VLAIIRKENAEPSEIRKWFSIKEEDVRGNSKVCAEIVAFVKSQEPKSVVVADKIIGCPHEEGIDYPDNQSCPDCEFWSGKNRWTGEHEH
jgi:hypothetical protein